MKFIKIKKITKLAEKGKVIDIQCEPYSNFISNNIIVHNCTFCYHSLGEKYRQRSVDKVIEEIKSAIEKWKINGIDIYDDLLSLDKVRLLDFCTKIKKIIKETPWEVKWTCQLSVISVNKELLIALKEAGCNVISFGFESYSPKVLKSMRKPITPGQINNAINLCREVNIGIQGNFIFGDTAETKETAEVTLDYWKKNGKGQILLGFIQPYPGSAIYKKCVEKGIIKDKLDFIKNKISHTNWINMTDKMTDEEILHLKKQILDYRRKYAYYLIPEKIEKIGKQRYNLSKLCPFCNSNQVYQNCSISNKSYYAKFKSCRNCHVRFFLVSRFYKFTMDYYNQLDFFRRNYLFLRDKIRKKRI
jgi:transcription elongation factor Elf1